MELQKNCHGAATLAVAQFCAAWSFSPLFTLDLSYLATQIGNSEFEDDTYNEEHGNGQAGVLALATHVAARPLAASRTLCCSISWARASNACSWRSSSSSRRRGCKIRTRRSARRTSSRSPRPIERSFAAWISARNWRCTCRRSCLEAYERRRAAETCSQDLQSAMRNGTALPEPLGQAF